MYLLSIKNHADGIHKPVEIDDIISAKIPNADNPLLKELELKWMIHCLRWELGTNSSCMINKSRKLQCRFSFSMLYNSFKFLVVDERPK